jgi:hypothetical protein
MVSYGMLRRVALVRTDVSEELSASFIRVTRIGELGTTLVVTSNRRTLRRNSLHCFSLLFFDISAVLPFFLYLFVSLFVSLFSRAVSWP